MQEIMSLASSVPSGHAQKLLLRAEGFVRPYLPDRSTQRKLVKLLQLRAGLPAILRGDAVKELIDILAHDPAEEEAVRELLVHFEDWGAGPHMTSPSVSDEAVAHFRTLARKPPALPCHEALDRELAHRLAAQVDSAKGSEALWQFALELGAGPQAGVWLEGAACVLAAVHGKIQIDLADLSDALLRAAARFLQEPRDRGAEALVAELFGYNLCRSSLSGAAGAGGSSSLAAILLERAKRCEANKDSDEEALLLEAYAADPTHVGVRERLLELLLGALESSGKVDREDVLLKLLFVQHKKVPEELLPKLSLDQHHVQALDPQSALALAEQLTSASRSRDGAKVAVLAAQAFDASGRREDAQRAYIRAYNMDRSNADASHGVVETCAELRTKIDSLERRVAEQQDLIEKLTLQVRERNTQHRSMSLAGGCGFAWDISEIDPAQVPNGQCRESPKFLLAAHGITLWIRYYPQGNKDANNANNGMASVFLHRSQLSKIECRISVGGKERILGSETPFVEAGEGRGWCKFIRIGCHREIRVRIDAVQLKDSALKCLY